MFTDGVEAQSGGHKAAGAARGTFRGAVAVSGPTMPKKPRSAVSMPIIPPFLGEPFAALWKRLSATQGLSADRRLSGPQSIEASRLYSTALSLLVRWSAFHASVSDLRDEVIPDDRSIVLSYRDEISEAVVGFGQALCSWLEGEARQPHPDTLKGFLAVIEAAALELRHIIDRNATTPLPHDAPDDGSMVGLLGRRGAPGRPRVLSPRLVRWMLPGPLIRLAGAAIVARREIERSEIAAEEASLKPGAVRARRLRDRRRRRVVLQVPLEVYAGDLDLLRRAGFLAGGDDPDAITEALQILLLETFLEREDVGLWRERFARQQPRLNSLKAAKSR